MTDPSMSPQPQQLPPPAPGYGPTTAPHAPQVPPPGYGPPQAPYLPQPPPIAGHPHPSPYAPPPPGAGYYGPPPGVALSVPPRAPDGRKWFQKKRFIVPSALFLVVLLLVVVGLVVNGAGEGSENEDAGADAAPVQEPADERAEPAAAKVTVPDVEGMSSEDAAAAVEAAGLTVGELEGDADGALVKFQFPAAGTRVDEGSVVDLTLAIPEPDGSREHPFPAGATLAGTDGAGTEEISVLLGAANWDAGAVIAAENQFNDPAPAGSVYVLLPVTITNLASEDAVVPWLAVDIAYVAPDGRSFDQASVVIPSELYDVGDLFVGGVGTGNMAFAVPTDALGGLWAVSYGWSDPAFVVAN